MHVKSISFLAAILLPASVFCHTYYPLADGNYWLLKSADPQKPKLRLIKVEAHPEIPDAYLLTRQTDDKADTFLIKEDREGVVLLEARVHTFFGEAHFLYDPPQIFFPEKLAVGVKWAVSGKTKIEGIDIATKTIAIVEGEENVETPAGFFRDCLRIKQDYYVGISEPTLSISETWMWLAPETGLVKERSKTEEFLLAEYKIVEEVAVRSKGKIATTWAEIKSR